ncbi:MAG: GNAT family N-acetyltransferase [Candidatus Micrarchaeia archaeon]|jgi:ribosomal protein S18 acetylase RimI-like enzyme
MVKYTPIERKEIVVKGERVLFRQANIADAPALAAVLNEHGVKEYLRDYGGTPRVALDILRNRKFWLVAQQGKKIIGAMRMRPEEHPAACDFTLAFTQASRGKGIASEALNHGLDWMRKNGFNNTTAYVGDYNAAVDFYKKNGFKVVAVIPNQFVLPKEFQTSEHKLGNSLVIQKMLSKGEKNRN